MPEFIIITVILAIVAFFYSSIGHGGASGYIAVLSIAGISSSIIKPSALILNILVASVSFIIYYRNKHFNWKLFYPFILLSLPMAYVGSFIELDAGIYKKIVGICLLISVIRLIIPSKEQNAITKKMSLPLAIIIGGAIGLLSGMIGMGGGIILSPVILLLRWGTLKETAAVSSLFIVVNSIAGLIGLFKQHISIPVEIYWWIPLSIATGLLGAYWGNKRAGNYTLKYVMTAILIFASFKLIFI